MNPASESIRSDGRHRRAIVLAAMALVLVFHFASELTSLITGLGFAAAGIAFALQTVILALAGYFSMVAPNGIRVGDRVSLQGPFGYVQGEVLDIGLVRIRLRELSYTPRAAAGTRNAARRPRTSLGGSIVRRVGCDERAARRAKVREVWTKRPAEPV